MSHPDRSLTAMCVAEQEETLSKLRHDDAQPRRPPHDGVNPTYSHHTVIVFHAHPDDEAIFTGLTMRRLADAGVRVVLVMATDGAAGVSRIALSHGESLRSRRLAELERSCDLLGVAKLEMLGYSDSGAHKGPYAAGTLGAAPTTFVARQVARIASREGASALIHYDPIGIYGHIDHVKVHRVGAMVTRRLQLAGYQATVDAAALRTGPPHVVQRATDDWLQVGVSAAEISVTVEGEGHELLAKMAAMATHTSQIGAVELDPAWFVAAYGREWFIREGGPGALDALMAAPLGRIVDAAHAS